MFFFFLKGGTLEFNLVPNWKYLADVREIKISGMFINMKIGQSCLEKVLKLKGLLKVQILKKI